MLTILNGESKKVPKPNRIEAGRQNLGVSLLQHKKRSFDNAHTPLWCFCMGVRPGSAPGNSTQNKEENELQHLMLLSYAITMGAGF